MSLMDNRCRSGALIRVPSSTSNLGPAFDAVGLALNLYLTVSVHPIESGPCRFEYSGEDAHLIPADNSNLIWRSMVRFAEGTGVRLPPFSLRVDNQIPIGRGLGSSAAALLASAAAASWLCQLGWNNERLLEVVAAVEGHPDNVAPSLWGGLVASISGETTLCSKSEFPAAWTVVAVIPDRGIETTAARSILPEQVPRRDAVYNIQRTAFLMAQLVQGRREGLRAAMSDVLHQPYRADLMPGLKEALAIESLPGLLGVAVSGAGSGVIAFADSNEIEIGARISDVFQEHGVSTQVRLLKADNDGIRITPL